MTKFRSKVIDIINDSSSALVLKLKESVNFKNNCKKFIESATEEQIDEVFKIKQLKEDLRSGRIRRNIVALIRDSYITFFKKRLFKDDKILIKHPTLGLYYTYLPFDLKEIIDNLYVVYTPAKNDEKINAEIKASFRASNEDVCICLNIVTDINTFPEYEQLLPIFNGKYNDYIDHEITHDLQYIRGGRKPLDTSKGINNINDYFNNPVEFEAYLDRIVDKVDLLDNNILKGMRDDYLKDHKELDNDFLTLVIDYALKNIPEDLKATYYEFIASLTPEHKQELYNEMLEVIDNKLFH